MPIQKFESFKDAEEALWCFEPDESYYKRVAELFKIANHLCPPSFPRGLFKYRTIEEANKQKHEWLIANATKKKRQSRE